MAEAIVVEAGGRSVSITHPDKVFFSQRGETKLDLVEYYLAVEGALMATVQRRPVLLERYPEGAGGKSFFQKRVPKSAPPTGSPPPSYRPPTARRATPSWRRTSATSCGA